MFGAILGDLRLRGFLLLWGLFCDEVVISGAIFGVLKYPDRLLLVPVCCVDEQICLIMFLIVMYMLTSVNGLYKPVIVSDAQLESCDRKLFLKKQFFFVYKRAVGYLKQIL